MSRTDPLPSSSERVRDPWPRELWWCENDKCNEPTCEDPCQFCGKPVVRYKVVTVEQMAREVERASSDGFRQGLGS